MDDLSVVYTLRERINRLESKLKKLTCENVQNNIEINRRTVARINKIQAQLTRLKCLHHDSIYFVYSGLPKRARSAGIIHSDIHMKISEIDIGDRITTLKMTPYRFKLDEKKTSLKDIVYPNDGTDRNLINTVARYRTLIDKSKDFCNERLEVDPSSIEMIIIGLDDFVRQYGGELSFSNADLSYANGTEYAACGIVNLGNIHLLVADFLPTAKFSIKLNLHYDRDITVSNSTMKHFIFNFIKEIAQLLQCKNDFIRIFSIENLDHRRGIIQVSFGLTTPERIQTITLARYFQNLLRRSDFRNRDILRFIQSNPYRYELIPSLSYLQISPADFHPQYNYNFTEKDLSLQKQYGKYPCHLPIGWFRHALNLSHKYPKDDLWFNHADPDQQWPIAYHGTHSQLENNDKQTIQSNFFVATHCNGGADAFTQSFIVSNGDHNQTFQLLFQCRIKPDSFAIRTGIVQVGQAWKINDPEAVRPYGLLLKKQ